MDKGVWLSPRALKLHAVILVVVPGFMALCIWQLDRAVGGNELSWAYVFEWPFFAAYAVYMWWRFVHEVPDAPAPAEDTPQAEDAAAAVGPASRDGEDAEVSEDAKDAEDAEDAELAAYNAYLAQLAARDKAAGR
ncbi:MAG TPA: hypothetical protein VIX84_22170 [Acidimicrobiales bacterium]